MTKNLDKADTLVKLILSITVLVLYAVRIISGPGAQVLAVLSIIIILIYLFKLFLNRKKIV